MITTLLGIGCFPESHQLSFGLLGLHGMAYANYAVHESDLIIGIGMRFDDRVTGQVEEFAPEAKVIHIDIDPAEIGKNVKTMVPIVGDVKNVLEKLNEEIQATSHQEWVEQIAAWRVKHPATEVRASDQLLPQFPIKAIYDITGATPSWWRTWASTRCGRPSSTGSTSPTPSSPPAAWAPWASPCRRPSGSRWPDRTRRCGWSSATAACR